MDGTGKIICVGRNYAKHARELGNEIPSEPVLFMKPASAVVPLGDPIHLPPSVLAKPQDGDAAPQECHHEIELAVCIGRRLSRGDVTAARGAIAAYGLALDLTLRTVQSRLKAKGLPWERAKAFDGSCPLSGWINADTLPGDPLFHLMLSVNGKVRQKGSSSAMLWSVPELIAHISETFTLYPGDVVLTGTPAGVAALKPGDHLAMELAWSAGKEEENQPLMAIETIVSTE